MTLAQQLSSLIIVTPLIAIALLFFIRHHSNRFIFQCVQSGFLISLLILSIANNATYTSQSLISLGNWPSHIAINLLIDRLSCFMFSLFTFIVLSTQIFVFNSAELDRNYRIYYIGVWLLLLGSFGALCSVDIFNLYVWFEVILLSAFVLMGATQDCDTKVLSHYAYLNIVGTLVILMSISMIYANCSSLNLLIIGQKLQSHLSFQLACPLLLFILGIGIKAGLFPFYFWLPSSYTKAGNSAVLMLSSVTTKVSVIVLARLAWSWPVLQSYPFANVFIALAILTMSFGVLGAASQTKMRPILSFHIVSQIGYAIVCLFIKLPLALAATLYFLLHNMLVKTNLLMVSSVVERQFGQIELSQLPKLSRQNTVINALFILSFLSLAGFPPLSGFWGKLLVFQATYQSHHYIALAFAVLVSIFTLYSMIKLWRFGFCQSEAEQASLQYHYNEAIAMSILLLSAIVIALFPDQLIQLFVTMSKELTSAQQLLPSTGVWS